MTADDKPRYPPSGPPWSLDTLADLHAGVFDERTTAALWPRVTADADARAVLSALDATRLDLATLADAPPIPVPEQLAARLADALAEEAAARPARSNVVSLTAARRRRQNRVLGWGSGLVAAAAAVAAVVLVALPNLHTTPGQGVAAGPPSATGSSHVPLALTSGNLGKGVLGEALRQHDPGGFADQQKLTGCLRANGVDPNAQVANIAQVTMNGQPATLLVLTTGKAAKFRLLVVDRACSAGNAATLGDNIVGPR